MRREGHEMRLAQGFLPPDFFPFCLGEVQKRRNRTLAPSNSVRVLPLTALQKDLISIVLNIEQCVCSH